MFRKNVAGQYLYFVLIKAADGTALTGATVTGKRAIDGAAQASVTGTITEEAGGQYKLALSQADSNGNHIGFLFTASSAIPCHIHVVTTAANPADATAFGLTNLDAAITSRLAPSGTLATVTNLTNAPTSGDLTTAMKTSVSNACWDELVGAHTANNTMGKAQGNIPTTAQIANSIWDENATLHTTANSTGKALADKAGYTLSATGLDAITQSATGAVEISKAIWDRVLTSATHNIVNSAGRLLRTSANTVTSNTAQSGGAAFIQLAASESALDGIFDPGVVRITGGTGAGQSRMIIQYAGATKIASVDRDWRVAPDNTSIYEIVSAVNLTSTNEGLAQGGSTTSITLNSSASAINDSYAGQTVVLRTGTGQDQARIITAYNGTTKVATLAQPWQTIPVAGTGYILWPLGRSQTVDMAPGLDLSPLMKASITTACTASTPTAAAVTGDVGGNVNGSVGSVIGAVGSVTAAVDITQAAANKVFGASSASLTELSQAQPPATPRPDQALMLLYMALRNSLTTTASSKQVKNSAGSTIVKKALSDDGTTYTEAQMVAGP